MLHYAAVYGNYFAKDEVARHKNTRDKTLEMLVNYDGPMSGVARRELDRRREWGFSVE